MEFIFFRPIDSLIFEEITEKWINRMRRNICGESVPYKNNGNLRGRKGKEERRGG
jgi:hypothetical protein